MTNGIVDRLSRCRTVHVDTQAIIYLLEDRDPWLSVVTDLFAEIRPGGIRGTSSIVTLVEVLVKPLKEGRHDLANAYREVLLDAGAIYLIPLDRAVAECAARIRAEHAFKIPDAVQLASALSVGADVFVTNDVQLRRFTEIDVVLLDDFVA